MLEEQLKELALIVKNDDLRKYAGNAFWNLIQAVISKDPVSGTLAGKTNSLSYADCYILE